MGKIRMIVEYDGTDFAGWQIQAIGTRTVQQTLTDAVKQISQRQVTIHGAGRTDAGVHALGQVAHFETESSLVPERWMTALNAVLPGDVSVRDVGEADDQFHARFSAAQRTYLYLISNRPARSAVWDRYSLHEPRPLDLGRMRCAAGMLVGKHDFNAFASSGGNPGSTTVRRVERLRVRRMLGGHLIAVTVTANAFLRSMVRNMVGSLIDAGRGALDAEDVGAILAAADRTRNPSNMAPAQGLCLYRVDYNDFDLPLTGNASGREPSKPGGAEDDEEGYLD